jgi:hypothetical protein
MSAIEIDAGTGLAASTGGADEISRPLESLPASSYVWRLVILLSLGGCFEIYELFLTGYIAPGLNRSGLLTTTTQAFFGFSGIGAFVAATFAGLFVGTFWLPRRPVRAAIDLYLCAARLYGRLGGDGVPDLLRGRAAVAVHRRDRHRCRNHHHRFVYH